MIDLLSAWTLARAVAGHELNGEAAGLPEAFGSMVARLAAVPVDATLTGPARQAALADARRPLWEAMLAARPDAAELVNALAGVDPSGPPPEPNVADDDLGPDAWPPLRLGELPPVDPFPLDALPEAAARLVVEGAVAIGCPPDFLGVPALAVAAGAIGRSVSLKMKDGYFAGSTLYVSCIGPPSDGKTPALKTAAAALRRIDERLEAEHAQAIDQWKKEASRSGPDGKNAKLPPPPRPRRIDVDDITMEALPIILADNPRGLVMVRDELTTLILGMNQFKGVKGNDRSNLLKIWSGDAIKKDRVNHEANVPIRCPHPCLSIVGGLTPDMLGELIDPKGRADGFIDRFLLCYPDPMPIPSWTERGVSEATASDWYDIVARLWQRPLNVKEVRSVPHVAFFTPEAESSWEAHFNAHAAEMNAADFPPSLAAPGESSVNTPAGWRSSWPSWAMRPTRRPPPGLCPESALTMWRTPGG